MAELPRSTEALLEGEGGGFPRWAVVAIALVLAPIVTGLVAGAQAGAAFGTLIYFVPLAIVLIAGWMVGLAITRPFARRGLFAPAPWPDGFRSLVAVALGLGAQALVVLFLGNLGLTNGLVIACVPLAGMGIGIGATRDFWRNMNRGLLRTPARGGDWLLLAAAVPVGILFLAATFPPGSLWTSEGRGYDVLEYHLQLPREYVERGSTAPLGHNVYSYLPANVEMLYLLVTQMAKLVLQDSSYLWGTYSAQFLHATLIVLSAIGIAMMPGINGFTGRVVAMLVFLGVPWTLVVGSLAYNEGGMLLFGILALAVVSHQGGSAARGILIGVLLGLAVGCKMTAGIFFALPVAAILMVRPTGQSWRTLAVAVGVAILVYAPWAVRAAVGSRGNPVFPIATSVLGRDGWTEEQSAAFDRGHGAPKNLTFVGRARALGRESLLDPQWSPSWNSRYSWSRVDPPDDARWKRVGLLWFFVPLGIALAFVGSRDSSSGPHAIVWLMALVIQTLGWMYFTHLQARFLLPAVVPLAVLMGRGAQGVIAAAGAGGGRLELGAVRIVVSIGVALHALATIFLLLPEAGLLGGVNAPRLGQAEKVPPIGELFSRQVNVADLAHEAVSPHRADENYTPPPPEKVLLVGDSTAWRFAGEVMYNTVFDHALMSDLVRMDPADAHAVLERYGVHYVWINWSEIERLSKTYGFDPAIRPEALAGWADNGFEKIPLEKLDSEFRTISLWRVR